MAIAHPIDWKWYNVSEYLEGHTKKEPTADEFVYYIKELNKLHEKYIQILDAELEDFRTLKSIINKFQEE